MADLEQKFQKAAEDVKKLRSQPKDHELLELYGLYKQATLGDNNDAAPAFYKLKESAKHKAWLGQNGKSKEDAMKEYIGVVENLIETYGLN